MDKYGKQSSSSAGCERTAAEAMTWTGKMGRSGASVQWWETVRLPGFPCYQSPNIVHIDRQNMYNVQSPAE